MCIRRCRSVRARCPAVGRDRSTRSSVGAPARRKSSAARSVRSQRMFDHVTIRGTDRRRPRRSTAQFSASSGSGDTRETNGSSSGMTSRSWTRRRQDRQRADFMSGSCAPSRAHVDASGSVGTSYGLADGEAPAERPHYKPDYYGALPHRPRRQQRRGRQHGSRSNQEWHRPPLAPHRGPRAATRASTRPSAQPLRTPWSATRDEPRSAVRRHLLDRRRKATENLHLAFEAPDKRTVDAFHQAGISPATRPTEPRRATRVSRRLVRSRLSRSTAHNIEACLPRPADYGRFSARITDGNSVELVNHNRTAAV